MALFQDNPLAFLLSTAVLLITTSCFLAISITLHSAYLWLAAVFIAFIFLATFTCTYSLPRYFVQDISALQENDRGENLTASQQQQGQRNVAFGVRVHCITVIEQNRKYRSIGSRFQVQNQYNQSFYLNYSSLFYITNLN